MSNRAAIRYAKAILEIAQPINKAEVIQNDMLLIASTLKENAELNDFVNNKVFSLEVKESAILEIFSSISEESKKLIKLLAQNKRIDILETVALSYINLYKDLSGVQNIQVTTAIALTPELESKVLAKAKEFTNKSLVIENIIDESIIGGFILRIGDKQYNASISNKLSVLKRELTN